ncbi:MAG TPA: twin-arginine translocase TatA/TatE family subunit [Alphaproteobacteria bacterium]
MGPSFWQIVLILVIVLILFGAGKLPRVMGDVAKGVKSFKAGMKEDVGEDAPAPKEVQHTEPAAAATVQRAAEPVKETVVKSDEPAKT